MTDSSLKRIVLTLFGVAAAFVVALSDFPRSLYRLTM